MLAMARKIKFILIGSAIVLGLGAGALWFGAQMLSGQNALKALNSTLPPGVTLRYENAEVSLFSREIILSKPELNWASAIGPQRVTAQQALLHGLPLWNGDSISLAAFSAHGIVISHGDMATPATTDLKLKQLRLTAPSLIVSGAQQGRLSAQAVQFEQLELNDTQGRIFQGSRTCPVTIGQGEISGMKDSLQAQSATLKNISSECCYALPFPALWQVEQISGRGLILSQILPPYTLDWALQLLRTAPEELHVDNAKLTTLEDTEGESAIPLPPQQTGGFAKLTATRTTSPDARGDIAFDLQVKEAYLPTEGVLIGLGSAATELKLPATIKADVRLQATQSPTDKTVDVVLQEIIAPELMRLSGHMGLNNVPLKIDNPFQLATMMLRGASFKIEDLGLIRQVVASNATKLQMRPDVYVDQLFLAHPLNLQGDTPGNRAIQQVYRATHSFLMNPGSFEIKLQPANPVTAFGLYSKLGRPDLLAALVNLQAVVEPPPPAKQ
jgi:hypothetical protein